MKTPRCTLLILLALQSCYCLAGDSPYYREFLRTSSGKPTPFQLTAASLVDTNNCSPAARRMAISLAPGALLGVRLGMSMDEIVSLWGKPIAIGCCRAGHPCFNFDDVWVYFEQNRVSELGLNVWMPFTPQFAGGLVPLSRTNEWIRLLGKPTNQYASASTLSLCYETNQTAMTLQFNLNDKQLSTVRLTRPPKADGPDINQ